MKLGKLAFSPDDRDLKLAAVMPAAVTLTPPPKRFGYGRAFKDWGMLGNDAVGDCVFAGAAHETMLWSHAAGRHTDFTDAAVLSDYSAVTGYDPADPNTDRGTDVRNALGYRRTTGIVDAAGVRHQIGAYIALTPGDYGELIQAAWTFLAVGIGFEFPDTAMAQFDAGEPWYVVPGAQVEGGHYVPVTGRDSRAEIGVITWGRRQAMSRTFYETYADEAWAMVSADELRAGVNRRGLDLAGLTAALKQLHV